jgi:demethylmenaquinone methyltransferase/2-methoxy-6-polyprenyl-1,4-benzoquinol methylase
VKVQKQGLEQKITLSQADSTALPFADATFDVVTVAFGVRNFEDLEKGLSEMMRVLKPNGRLFVLEFSKPQHTPMRQLFRFYFHRVMPLIGRTVSKDSAAYTYLPKSVDAFPEGPAFLALLEKAGGSSVKATALTGGIAALYQARKAR